MAQGALLQATISPSKAESPFLLLDCGRILAVMGLLSGVDVRAFWGCGEAGGYSMLSFTFSFLFNCAILKRRDYLRRHRCIRGTKLKFMCVTLRISRSLFLPAVIA